MNLRKINAILSLLTTVMLLDHACFGAVVMLSRGMVQSHSAAPYWLLAGFVVVHAVLSMAILRSDHKGGAKKQRMYPKLNAKTRIQRGSGVVLLLLLALHIIGVSNGYRPLMLHAVGHPLFYGAALAHAAVSLSRAMITLGIGSARLIRWVDTLMPILCAGIYLADVVGFWCVRFWG